MSIADVLVIGAGPAGLAAARAARERGASVTLLDSSDQLGGQFWRHLPDARPSSDERALHHGWDTYRGLRHALESENGCRIIRSAHVWAIEASATGPGTVHVIVGESDGVGRERLAFAPGAMILATGAHDRILPFPGWDLPGVFSGGAAQALAKGERLGVGRRVIVAGAGPFLLPVAASLSGVGSTVLGVFEANRAPALLRGWLPRPWQLLPAAGKAVELAGYVAGHIRNRIPYRLGRMVVAAHGTDRVEAVTLAAVTANWTPIDGTQRTVEVDAVCVSHGFTPRLELAIAAGCALTADRFVRVDEGQQTSVPGVYAVGEITGIGGADLAMAEGVIAGHIAAGGLVTDNTLRRAVRQRRIFRGFARRIDAAHAIRPGWQGVLTADTIVCRCEEVTFGTLCATAESTRSRSLRALKLSTRAGLGICQGRVCGRSIEEVLATRVGNGGLRDGVTTDRRPIAALIRLGELATDHHGLGVTPGPHNPDRPPDPMKGTK